MKDYLDEQNPRDTYGKKGHRKELKNTLHQNMQHKTIIYDKIHNMKQSYTANYTTLNNDMQ